MTTLRGSARLPELISAKLSRYGPETRLQGLRSRDRPTATRRHGERPQRAVRDAAESSQDAAESSQDARPRVEAARSRQRRDGLVPPFPQSGCTTRATD